MRKHEQDKNCCAEFVKGFDFYKDLPDSLSEPTLTGASVSLVLLTIIVMLISQSTYNFLQFQKESEIMIDVNSGEEKLHINLDITLPKCPCDILSLDIVDVTGVHVVDIEGKLHKHRLDKNGNEIEVIQHIDEKGHAEVDAKQNLLDPDYHASDEGVLSTQEVTDSTVKALAANEGCKLSGFVFINKVPGNFHISGHHYPEAVQKLFFQGHKLDFSHKINHLSFGDVSDIKQIENNFNEKFNFELDGRDIPQSNFMSKNSGNSMFGPSALIVNYFLEISQVDYVDQTSEAAKQSNEVLQAYQFRSSQTIKLDMGMPAIFFRYELSPIRIQYTMSLQSVTTFLVHICAIVGGVYACSSIFESVLRNSISILSIGSLDEQEQKKNAQRSTMKRVKRVPANGGQGANTKEPQGSNGLSPAYAELNLDESDSIELTNRN